MEIEKTMSEVLLDAAESIQIGHSRFTCHAAASGGTSFPNSHSDVGDFYEHLMVPSTALKTKRILEPEDFGDICGDDYKKLKVIDFRVLALCMAAAVAEAGGLQ